MKNFLKVDDFSKDELCMILDRADFLQRRWKENRMPRSLQDKKVALWFWGQGFRNRVAFEIGARSMGADVSFIPGDLGVHEPIEDIAHYLNNWFSLLVVRCKDYDLLSRVVADSSCPVINARTSRNHPCEIIGDLQYVRQKRGSLDGLNVVFVGELTNLCMSWFEAAKVLPISVTQVAPEGYLAPLESVKSLNENAAGSIRVSSDMESAVTKGTDVLYTDCWPKGAVADNARQSFLPYQITRETVSRMNPNGFYLPCPPITRGEEVSEDSLSTSQYCDYQAKDCLLHSQNAIMEYCLA